MTPPRDWVVYTALIMGFPLLMVLYLFFAGVVVWKKLIARVGKAKHAHHSD